MKSGHFRLVNFFDRIGNFKFKNPLKWLYEAEIQGREHHILVFVALLVMNF